MLTIINWWLRLGIIEYWTQQNKIKSKQKKTHSKLLLNIFKIEKKNVILLLQKSRKQNEIENILQTSIFMSNKFQFWTVSSLRFFGFQQSHCSDQMQQNKKKTISLSDWKWCIFNENKFFAIVLDYYYFVAQRTYSYNLWQTTKDSFNAAKEWMRKQWKSLIVIIIFNHLTIDLQWLSIVADTTQKKKK